jgi:hypothetical protein
MNAALRRKLAVARALCLGWIPIMAFLSGFGCGTPQESSVSPPEDIGATVRRVLAEARQTRKTGEAVETLEALGSPAVSALLESLGSGDASTRETAARALGRLKDPRAIEPLIELFEEGGIPEWAALEAIPRMGTPVTATLLERLERRKDDVEAASRLLRMVRAISNPDSLPVLLKLYPERDEWLRAQIAEAVRAISPETYTGEIAPLEYERIDTAFEYDPVRFALESCRLAQNYEPGIELLRRALRHSGPAVRGATLDCDPPLGGRGEALRGELSSLLGTRSLRERFEAVVDTQGLAEAVKFVDAHFLRRPPRVGADDYRFVPFDPDGGAAEPFWPREPSCPRAPYTLGASANLRYDPEYEVVVKVPGRPGRVIGPGRWPAVNEPDVAREVTVYGEGQSVVGRLNRVEWACADPCGDVAVLCSWEARYWTGQRGWQPKFVVPGRHEVEPVDVSRDRAASEEGRGAWSADSIQWASDGGSIEVFAEGQRVISFTGDYTGPHFDVYGRLQDSSTGSYVVRIVGKFWQTNALMHRAGDTWHSHEGAVHEMGGTCEDAGELVFQVPGFPPIGGYWEWPWLAVAERAGSAKVVWERSSDASVADVLLRIRGGEFELGPLLTATFAEGCQDVLAGKGWPAPGSSCEFGLGERKRYRLTSIASEGRHTLVLQRERPIEARQEFLLLPQGVSPSKVRLIFAGDLDLDGHVDLVVSAPVCDCPSKDRRFELLLSDWGDRYRLLENPLLRSAVQYAGSPSEN